MSKTLEEVIEKQKEYRKQCSEKVPVGERQKIGGVDCILHIPGGGRKFKPVFLFLHGGAWIGGDAYVLDSLCETIAVGSDCLGVNINYTKLDEKPFPFAMEEVIRVIEGLNAGTGKFGADSGKIVLCGCSAGAHVAAGTAVLAVQKKIKIAKQILVYPFTDWTGRVENPLDEWGIEGVPAEEWKKLFFSEISPDAPCVSPAAAPDCVLRSLAPAEIIVSGKDVLREHGILYYERLKNAGTEVTLKEYENAVHGFLETERREYYETTGKSPDAQQSACCRDCEKYITDIMKNI